MKRVLKKQNKNETPKNEFYRISQRINNFNELRTKVFLLAILSFSLIFTSCNDDLSVVPSSKVTTTNFPASGVSQLDVSDVFNVYVSFSATEESVQVEANENLHSLIEMSQSGNKLIVGLQKNTSISGAPVLNVYIKTATLSSVKAEGASSVEFENLLETTRFDVEITGASKVSGSIKVDKLVANLTGASLLDVSGESNSFDIDASGASEMSDFDFVSNSLTANLSGASDIMLTVNEKLNVTATGASNVYYKGNGIIESQNLSDASKIINMN